LQKCFSKGEEHFFAFMAQKDGDKSIFVFITTQKSDELEKEHTSPQ